MKKPTLILFCGLPGSGKTTLARALEQQMPGIRLCPDEWMADLGIDPFNETFRNKLEIRLWQLALSLISGGQNVILENGLWTRAERDQKLLDTAHLEADVEMHYLNVPFDELVHRIRQRNTTGGHGTVSLTRAQIRSYADLFEPPTEAELGRYTRSTIHTPTAPIDEK